MSTRPLTRVVLADMGNVVVRATHAITHAILEDLGIAPEAARRFFANPAYTEFACGTIDGHEFAWQVTEVHLRCRLDERYVRIAHDAHIYALDEAVRDVLARVTVPLMIATDTNAWQTERTSQLVDMGQLARRVFRSDELGSLKRDPGTFERIAEAIGEEPRRICFIDDSAQNIARAARAGFDAVQFTDASALVAALRARRIWTA
jgi:HAD superfamily hydrolase (TIGR01509 family)